ncbi:N-acetylglucosamine-6-phosphate deacetylase [Azospirillum doebereinerae]|uniref:N-acetylglucosamine-6-phosphate deacetylase n=1 Tax=Azospirillum doebereinerae TaxID=92933 RepID=UPI001EE5E6D4|nr:N-acetylglucosamine-6-phosphate deacetylase [Azospirillum doebereinerae]MCG5243736.1 N-acetylglucosamine-6-phosphate deacetylase [Azospirillum doebereinerae]
MTRRLFLAGARLFTGDALLDGHGLLVEDGRILDLLPAGAAVEAEVVRLPEDSLLAPGFIDAQVNGAGGVLFNDSPTVESALAIAAALRRSGTVGLLPTLITDERGRTEQATRAALAASALPGSGVLGVHLEGPFLSPERPGVHEPRFIRHPDDADIGFLTGAAAGSPDARVLVTLAPERVSDEALARLSAGGVILSAGHSAAGLERVGEAAGLGLRGVTHLFNAMPPIVNRAPGLALAGMQDPRLWCGVIADGVHVHPALLRLTLAAKPPGRVFLVTDAMPPVGTDATSFTLYGRTIHRRDGRLETEDGTLAGADIDMIGAVRNAMGLLGVTLEEALRMASLYPAAFLGLEDRYGRLAPGHRAALVLLGPGLEVLGTWV